MPFDCVDALLARYKRPNDCFMRHELPALIPQHVSSSICMLGLAGQAAAAGPNAFSGAGSRSR